MKISTAGGRGAEVGVGDWPATWSPTLVRRWQKAGGGPAAAHLVQGAGWGAKQVRQMLGSVPSLPEIVAVPTADDHVRLGLSLTDLLTGQWPAAPHGTVVSVRRTSRRGGRTVLCLVGDPAGIRREEWLWRKGEWHPGASTDLAAAGDDLVVAMRPMLRARPGWITEVRFDATAVVQADVLLALTVSAPWEDEDGESWEGSALAEEFIGQDEELVSFLEDLPLVRRWASVGDLRVVGLIDRAGARPSVRPMLVDLDEQTLVGEPVAEYSWFSESGGAPVSWDGRRELIVLGPGIGVDVETGDQGVSLSVRKLGTTRLAQATALATWVVHAGAEVAAAMALEPLDPEGVLSAQDRLTWVDQLGSVTLELELHADDRTLSHVRALLAQGPTYAAVKAALAHPRSEAGERLSGLLEAFCEDGVLGPLLQFGDL